MPRLFKACPARILVALRAKLPASLLAKLVIMALAIMAGCRAQAQQNVPQQTWAAQLLGVQVGEMRLSLETRGQYYVGTGSFQTTGLVGKIARVGFLFTADGTALGSDLHPSDYRGRIDTGKRISKTHVTFTGSRPRLIEGEGSPAAPITQAQIAGAIDPLSAMIILLRDIPAKDLCTFDKKTFDGTRVARLELTSRKAEGAMVTCEGLYHRVGGYGAHELAEIRAAPASITYVQHGDIWRPVHIRAKTRHGWATLVRQQ